MNMTQLRFASIISMVSPNIGKISTWYYQLLFKCNSSDTRISEIVEFLDDGGSDKYEYELAKFQTIYSFKVTIHD